MPKRKPRPALPAQYSVWLLPEPTIESMLVQTLAQLSSQLGGPGFAPHVTVQGDIALPLELLEDPVRCWAESCRPLHWTVAQVECEAQFFRSLYLRFDDSASFKALQSFAHHSSKTSRGLSPFPHLSLAYGAPHPDTSLQRAALAEQFVGQDMVFDRLAIYRSSKAVPVPEWECLARFPLTAP